MFINAQGDEVDIWDMSAPLSPLKQMLGLMRMSSMQNGDVMGIAAQYALALGQLREHGYGSSFFLGAPNLEAELTRMAMHMGPQLQCEYRTVC